MIIPRSKKKDVTEIKKYGNHLVSYGKEFHPPVYPPNKLPLKTCVDERPHIIWWFKPWWYKYDDCIMTGTTLQIPGNISVSEHHPNRVVGMTNNFFQSTTHILWLMIFFCFMPCLIPNWRESVPMVVSKEQIKLDVVLGI